MFESLRTMVVWMPAEGDCDDQTSHRTDAIVEFTLTPLKEKLISVDLD